MPLIREGGKGRSHGPSVHRSSPVALPIWFNLPVPTHLVPLAAVKGVNL